MIYNNNNSKLFYFTALRNSNKIREYLIAFTYLFKGPLSYLLE